MWIDAPSMHSLAILETNKCANPDLTTKNDFHELESNVIGLIWS